MGVGREGRREGGRKRRWREGTEGGGRVGEGQGTGSFGWRRVRGLNKRHVKKIKSKNQKENQT